MSSLTQLMILASCYACLFLLNAYAANAAFISVDDVQRALAQDENTLSSEEIKFRDRLRRLHGDSADLTQDDEVPMHTDNGPGWPIPGNESYAATEAMQQKFAQMGNRASFPRIVQPISFINFVQKDGTGYASYDSFVQQVEQLNRAYSGQEAKAGGYSQVTDTNIRFKLAGVRYVVNDDYFNLCALPSYIQVIRPKYMMSGAIHLNVYVCWCQANLGLSWLPYDSWFRQNTNENHFALGAIVHWQLLPGNNFNKGLWSKGNILTHEIGHCYGLRHPYEGDCYGDESNSDQISDTPRMTGNPLSTCAAVRGRDSCPNLAGKDDMQTYMVATADTCRNHFTPGQVQYMQQVIQTYKPTLMRQLLPSCVAAIDSTDYSPDLQPCLSGTVATAANGQQWCKTDPDNAAVWAWACCPQSLDWDTEPCRQGTPVFDLPPNVIPTPKSGGQTRPSDTPATLTKKPTSAPTTTSPTKLPTLKPTKKPTKTPTNADGSVPTNMPTNQPTRKPQNRRRKKKKALRRG